ncbi:hypothetical protein NMG60_11013493 [Bertholletia excelsa]
MGGLEKIKQGKDLKRNKEENGGECGIAEGGNNNINIEASECASTESSLEGSTVSLESSSSTDVMEDATSSSSSSSSSLSSCGALCEWSDLMAQLPIKRGLSKYYQGKSQTFASLASVKSLEELAKKERPQRRKMMKSCKSYGGGLDHLYSPKAAISKKTSTTSRVSLFSSLGRRNASGFSNISMSNLQAQDNL